MFKNVFIFSFIFLISCKNKKQDPVISERPIAEEVYFFPVTEFLQGQIFSLKDKSINPLMFVTRNNKTDSVWLKIEDVSTAVSPFLETTIDSVHLAKKFTGSSFLDQTINAYTFSYDPVNAADTNTLKHCDVYVDPNSNKVNRVYIVKQIKDTTLQLTWQTNSFCKMLWIRNAEKPIIEKEILIKWDF